MTYKELIERLKNLDETQLNMDVTVQDGSDDECYPAKFAVVEYAGTLDKNHPVFFFRS